MQHRVSGADAPFDIVWDTQGVAHVYASSVADAYRGMGYAAGSERLWQIHLSSAFANGEAAALLGERWVRQDAIQRACNVHGKHTGLPASDGDWVVDAYLDGLNSWVDGLAEVPAEFLHADAEPRRFSRADVAARYRFTSWFQHKSWTEKMLLGRLMASHGVDYFRGHVNNFSAADESMVGELNERLRQLDLGAVELAYPEVTGDASAVSALTALSGSNNWAVRGELSASGKPMLATDPHQPHSIPNTFFYVHLHAPGWDVFGAAFPGVPYFMMGYTRDVAWGLTTGFIDCYDVFLEELRGPDANTPLEHRAHDGWHALQQRTEHIAIKGGSVRDVAVARTGNGVLLESLQESLGMRNSAAGLEQTALHWTLDQVPSSAGSLARLPLAKTANEFGELLFEDDVCPLVNNIICVDGDNNLQRYIAATLPARQQFTGSVPLAGWRQDCEFPRSKASELLVESNPERGFSFTANNDTLGDTGPYPVHNFPIHSARADRIEELLSGRSGFTPDDFTAMQLDLLDRRALEVVPQILGVLGNEPPAGLAGACELLAGWNCEATADSAAACIYYPFINRFWQREFMHGLLGDPVLDLLPLGAPGLNRFDISAFLASGSPWRRYDAELREAVSRNLAEVVAQVAEMLGSDLSCWRWGDLQKVSFKHSLAKFPHWQDMRVGPLPLGGSATTLAMAMYVADPEFGSQSVAVPCRVYHGPAYRLVVDLADPMHAKFVIAGGNGGRVDSRFVSNQFSAWQCGDYFTLCLERDSLDVQFEWSCR